MSYVEEPAIGDVSPVVAPGVEVEPMLLLDTTGSMNNPNQEGSTVARKDVIGEAMGLLVERLAAQDSQAAKEAAAGEDAGGLRTITFAAGSAQDLGDLSPDNWKQKWAQIRWEGGTVIMPGWTKLVDTYLDEFGDQPAMDRPQMLGLIITDGEANDTYEFATEIGKASTRTHVLVAVCGFGTEHDKALEIYQKIAATNDHVRVVSFGNQTDPGIIGDALASLLNV